MIYAPSWSLPRPGPSPASRSPRRLRERVLASKPSELAVLQRALKLAGEHQAVGTTLGVALAQMYLRGRSRMSFRRQLGQLHHHADLADVSARLKVQEGRI